MFPLGQADMCNPLRNPTRERKLIRIGNAIDPESSRTYESANENAEKSRGCAGRNDGVGSKLKNQKKGTE